MYAAHSSENISSQMENLYGPNHPGNKRMAKEAFAGRKWLDSEMVRDGGVAFDVRIEGKPRRFDSLRLPPTPENAQVSQSVHQKKTGAMAGAHIDPLKKREYQYGSLAKIANNHGDRKDYGGRNHIPERQAGESFTDYYTRASGQQDVDFSSLDDVYGRREDDADGMREVDLNSPQKYQMPQGRVADGMNAIYQPNGRWIFYQGRQVFEPGRVVNGKFVHQTLSPYTGLAPTNEFPGLKRDLGGTVDVNFAGPQSSIKNEEEGACWSCTGISIATVAAVAALVLGVIVAVHGSSRG